MSKSINNLLSLNNKALQFAHDVDGFDFEKPFFITESADRFTVNTVKKSVAEAMNPAKCKIVLFVVPGVHCYKSGLYYAILRGGKFDGTRREGAKYWNYRTTTGEFCIDHCYGVGDFEELRKKQTESVFIIAQDKSYITEPETKIFDVSRRYALDDARKSTDGRGNDYIKSLVLTATDGSGARFTYEPYNTFYGNEKRSAEIADHIDKSGYLLRPHRFALMERAETLRRTRKQAEATAAVALTHTNSRDYFNFGVKTMSEASGPCEDRCPASILSLLSPTSDEYAIKWRERCRANIEKKKDPHALKNLPVGAVIRFIKYNGEAVELMKHPAAYQFKRPFWYCPQSGGYMPATRIPDSYEVVNA